MSLNIEFRGTTKSFGPVQVLHGVDFALPSGQILGLLGENGAGKSTLMKILAGFEQASGGQLLVDGQPRVFANSREAEALGIVLIHQEFSLAEDLTIAQNLFLGHEKRRGWGRLLLNDDAMRAEARLAIAQVGLVADVDTRVKDLIVAEKQLVEIARALMRKARVLVMDEPTATLTPTETERLFGLMRQLKSEGVTLVYISHKLDEVERMTDNVVVMRDGICVAQHPTAELTRQQMANLMVGRELADLYPPKSAPPATATPALRVQGMSVPGWAHDVSFAVHPGEILGFAGLVGAGRTEMFEGIMGLRAGSADTVELQGQPHTIRSPRDAVRLGLTYLSEDRKGKGLHVNFGLGENLTLMALERYATPLLQPAQEDQALAHAVDEFGIRTGSLHIKASSLSGGNQQKVALAKVLHSGPKVVVLDEPTRGVDVGAKRDIYLLIQKLASQGIAVIIISSELMELIGLCHRVAVMRAGRLQTVLESEQLTEEDLIAHATGTHYETH